MLFPAFRRKPNPSRGWFPSGLIPGGLLLAAAVYLILFEPALHSRNEETILPDLICAGLALLLSLDLARRTSGLVVPFLAVFLLSYLLWWGRHLTGVFAFRGMALPRVLYRMFFTDEGLFGMITTISSTYVFILNYS